MTDLPSARAMSDHRLSAELTAQYLSSGGWTTQTLRDLLTRAAAEHPDRVAAMTVGPDSPEALRQLTYRELDDLSRRISAGLRDLGIQSGDAVAVMLPNWVEFAATIYGILGLGGIYTGIPVAYGSREVEIILRRSHARVLIIPPRFRSANHLELIRNLRSTLPELETVVVLGDAPLVAGEVPFSQLLEADPLSELPDVDASWLAHIGFTSGTTGEPKGVMNTHQTLEAVMRQFVDHIGVDSFGRPPVNLVASPVGHHTGFLWGVLLTVRLGGTAVYLERWSAAHAMATIATQSVTVMWGAPTFLQDLLRQTDRYGTLPTLETVVVAGAPVPRALPAAALAAFGCWVCPAWGMTEWGIGISQTHSRDARGDGQPVATCDIQIVDEDGGRPVTAGTHGRLLIRGPGLFVGYCERPEATAEAFNADGYFDTGDVAERDEDGYVFLRGRSKDIIIRGGENIPVTEVESVLLEHPDIVDVAVVGTPDPRFGERAAAVIVTRDGTELELSELTAFLRGRGLSLHYLPERVVTVSELPKTASGKIRKNELRDWLAAEPIT